MIPASTHILKDLGGGLVMRRSSAADADRLAEFNARIHGDNPRDGEAVAAWTRDLLTRPHPTFHPDDFVLIEDLSTGAIASTLCLIDQAWTYEGIPFAVGRPELVGTDPAYRNRGLVRDMFEVIHAWSRERAQPVQFITGIPYFYRQFGYEMALEMGGGRMGYEPHVPPPLKAGEQEPFAVRLAEEKDIPWLMMMYQRECAHSLVSTVMDEALWRYEICGKSANNVNYWAPCVIETPSGEPVGYLVHPVIPWGENIALTRYAVAEGVSYRAVNDSVIRFLWSLGKQYAADWERKLSGFYYRLGSDHPAYHAEPWHLPGENKSFAHYVRVPDLPAFIRLIAPALESRLAQSVAAGHSGELKLNFYRGGVKLVFEKGCLASTEEWKAKIKDDEGTASFPGLTFLMLLFGYRSIPEIGHLFADCWANSEAEVLLTILFPKKPSHVWSVS